MNHLDVAKKVVADRHGQAIAAFWAGSLSRGEGTPTSDIDLVIVHPRLAHAWRDSFRVEGRLCETFVHDVDSLTVFYGKDTERGVPTLMRMVAEGVSLIDGEACGRLQSDAQRLLVAGPPEWTRDEVDRSRYFANDLIDDLAGSDSADETRSIAATLFAHAFTHHRRMNGKWGATGKHVVRTLLREEGALGLAYLSAFEQVFVTADPTEVVHIVKEIYAPCGGLLETWRSDAPPHRSSPPSPSR